MHSLAVISSWHESNEFLCHDLHIMTQLITPDVALPWKVHARVRESLSKYSIKELRPGCSKSAALDFITSEPELTAIALSRNTSIIPTVTGEPFLNKVRHFEIVLSGRSVRAGWFLDKMRALAFRF